MVLKYQRFGDSGSDKTELKGLKRKRLDERDDNKGNGLENENENSLDKNEFEMRCDRYIHPLFVPLLSLPQKVSKRSSDLGKGIKSLKYIIWIPKICYSRSANFALEFPGRGGLKAQKKFLY